MFWLYVIGAVLVLWLATRRVLKRRNAPTFDQRNLENANYARINQEVRNVDRRFGKD